MNPPVDLTSPVADPRRLIELEAAHNVRDLGGYRLADGREIAWGRLLRGDGLHHLTDADLDALAPIGLRTVVDLRTHGELDERGTFPHQRVPLRFVHLPVIDATWDHGESEQYLADLAARGDGEPEVEFLAWAYRRMLLDGGPGFGAAVRTLAEPGALPAIFHCAAGKDRTGILAALVLTALGVDDEVVVADYALTAAAMPRLRAWLALNRPEANESMADTPSAFFAAHPAAMQLTLDHVRDTHGSSRSFLAAHGVDDARLAALADALTVT
ncbi:MAG: tyrosine-protein phosphatase [Desertimonas sp.]